MASFIPMILSLSVNPLIAKNMAPEDYAIVGYYNSFNTLIAPLITFYLLHYYSKSYFELDEKSRNHLKAMIMQSLVYFSLLLSLLALFSIFIYMYFFNSDSSIPFLPYAILSVFTIPLTGIYSLILVDYKMQKDSKNYFYLSVSNGLISVFLSILFIVILKYGAFGRLTAAFLANLFFFLWGLYHNLDVFREKFDFSLFKKILQFTWPLTIAAMLGFFSSGYERVFLERLDHSNELGFYIVAVQMVAYITVFRTAISSTFDPDIYEAVVNRNWLKLSKIILIVITLISVVVVGFIIAAPFIVNLLTAGRYTYSAKYARIIALSQITTSIYYSVSQITIALGLTKITMVNKISCSILNVLMFSFFISKWQFMGAAWGTVISSIVFMAGNIGLVSIWKIAGKNK